MKRRRSRESNGGDVEGGSASNEGGSAVREKRTRRLTNLHNPIVEHLSDSETEASPDRTERPRKVRRTLSHIHVSGPTFPRSAYQGWTPALPETTEVQALTELEAAFDAAHAYADQKPEYIYFTLDDFSIYRPDHPKYANELSTLDRLNNNNGRGVNELIFDGVLRFGDESRFVKGVRFNTMTIDSYNNPDVITLKDHICIQSTQAKARQVWYKLRRPSGEYKRFYDPFMWLAQFTKYFVDYMFDMADVTLEHFRMRFYSWLCARYRRREEFGSWLDACRLRDFRTTVAAHVGFLWKECSSVDDDQTGLCREPIWGEVVPWQLEAIPEHEPHEHRTIVTPFAFDCFRRMYFHEQLEARSVTDKATLKAIARRKKTLGLTPFGASQNRGAAMMTPKSLSGSATDDEIQVDEGDVVGVEQALEGVWKDASPVSYAYVQAIRRDPDRTSLDVLWLYEPRDTTLGNKAYYPFRNELFLSDNCDCGKSAIDLSCVTCKADVKWFVKDPTSVSGLFVRQKYRTSDDEGFYDFASLQQSDFECWHSKKLPIFEECRREYQIGDAVLVRDYCSDLAEDRLEPAQIVDFNMEMGRVVLRRLRRKTEVDRHAKPNELVLTEETFEKKPESVIRTFHLRFFTAKAVMEGLPIPYDRDGTGDFYFITTHDGSRETPDRAKNITANPDSDSSAALNNASTFWPPLEQGLDPVAPSPFEKLKGMGIFCGGGNFDRGLEEGGAVEFQYGIDWAERALHSYRANAYHPEKVQYFLGSVNDYLAEALAGSKAKSIALPGGVNLISAGSPCPGFSNLQQNKNSQDSLRNASMVASVVSFVDFYCPEYCILENVVSMSHAMGANKDENVFAQVLAALVALGYQVQQYLMDAWSYSSCQKRSRVFIIASAPGLEPLPFPNHSHARPPRIKFVGKSLGKSSNGLRFGTRREDVTPFEHLSPGANTADLPDIADAQPQLCPQFPDHRTPSEQNSERRAVISVIPISPRGMTLAKAAQTGLLTGKALEYYENQGHKRKGARSKTLSRVDPDMLFSTVTTVLKLECDRTGWNLHWNQHRPLTVMELRRAQGFLDHEVIIGSPAQQVTIIGNSVDRKVALVLGLSLRESWLKSYTDSRTKPQSHVGRAGPRPSPAQRETQPLPNRKSDYQYRLSQEEREHVHTEPAHGFRMISQIMQSGDDLSGSADQETSDVLGAITTHLKSPPRSPPVESARTRLCTLSGFVTRASTSILQSRILEDDGDELRLDHPYDAGEHSISRARHARHPANNRANKTGLASAKMIEPENRREGPTKPESQWLELQQQSLYRSVGISGQPGHDVVSFGEPQVETDIRMANGHSSRGPRSARRVGRTAFVVIERTG